MAAAIGVPSITQDDLVAFHSRTFGSMPPRGSLPQSEDPAYQSHLNYGFDDGLGFYPDGKKRTLTDDQIAMFRSSEIYGIVRKRELVQEKRDYGQDQKRASEITQSSQPLSEALEEVLPDKRVRQKASHMRKGNKKQKLEPRPKGPSEKEDDLPSRRIIRELDHVPNEEQILDY